MFRNILIITQLKSNIINLFGKSVYSFVTHFSVLLFKIVYTSIFYESFDIAFCERTETCTLLNRQPVTYIFICIETSNGILMFIGPCNILIVE